MTSIGKLVGVVALKEVRNTLEPHFKRRFKLELVVLLLFVDLWVSSTLLSAFPNCFLLSLLFLFHFLSCPCPCPSARPCSSRRPSRARPAPESVCVHLWPVSETSATNPLVNLTLRPPHLPPLLPSLSRLPTSCPPPLQDTPQTSITRIIISPTALRVRLRCGSKMYLKNRTITVAAVIVRLARLPLLPPSLTHLPRRSPSRPQPHPPLRPLSLDRSRDCS